MQTNLLHLSIFIPPGKNGKSLCKSCKILGYSTSTSKAYTYIYIHYSFL